MSTRYYSCARICLVVNFFFRSFSNRIDKCKIGNDSWKHPSKIDFCDIKVFSHRTFFINDTPDFIAVCGGKEIFC